MSEFWRNKQVVVTGGSGLIGGPLCKRLEALGARVFNYDLSSPGHWDIMDRSSLLGVVRQQDVVIHLAADSGVEHSRQAGYDGLLLNIQGTLNVLEACRNTSVKALMVASSNHIYGDHEGQPTDERAALLQLDTYSVSKICADYLARCYAHNYGVPTVVIRNTNCYGPDDPHLDHIIPATILATMQGRPMVIKGTGRTAKSYLHVADVVESYLKGAEWCALSDAKGEAFNIAGERIVVASLVWRITSMMGREDLRPIVEGHVGDNQDEDLDWSKARTLLGWKPEKSLIDGLRETIEAFRARYGQGVAVHPG